MIARARVLQLLALFLYAGPLLAGLARHDMAVLPAFIAIFVLWQIVMRPMDWPRRLAEWSGDGVIAGALARVLLMVVLVGVCYGLGRGIAGALDVIWPIPLAVPLLLSFLAVPLSRMTWNPAEAAEMERFLDEAIARIGNPGATPAPGLPERGAEDDALAGRLLEPLSRFPADTGPETVSAHLRAIAAQVDAAALRRALILRVAVEAPPAPLALALALHASDPRTIEIYTGDDAARAFHALPDHPLALALFAERAAEALAADPALWGGFPTNVLLEERARRLAGSEAEAPLRALIALSRAVAPADAQDDPSPGPA